MHPEGCFWSPSFRVVKDRAVCSLGCSLRRFGFSLSCEIRITALKMSTVNCGARRGVGGNLAQNSGYASRCQVFAQKKVLGLGGLLRGGLSLKASRFSSRSLSSCTMDPEASRQGTAHPRQCWAGQGAATASPAWEHWLTLQAGTSGAGGTGRAMPDIVSSLKACSHLQLWGAPPPCWCG